MKTIASCQKHTPMRQRLLIALAALCLFAAPILHATVTTGPMTVPRMLHQASPLPDGKILITGGYARPGTTPYASTEIFDPTTSLFAASAPMNQARTDHAAVALRDGRIMVFGGSIVTSPAVTGTRSTELYDPATGVWSPGPDMSIARYSAQAHLLPDGKVFVTDKLNYGQTPYAEIYDPQTNTFAKTGNMLFVSTYGHGVVPLADGRVLKAGGYSGYANPIYSRFAEIWTPATNQWTVTGQLNEAREGMQPVLLGDGKVMVAGGGNYTSVVTTEIYDPATGVFSVSSSIPRAIANGSDANIAIALPTGEVILMNEHHAGFARYQPSIGEWNMTGPRPSAPRDFSVALLPRGDLLIAGGADLNDATNKAAVWTRECATQAITVTSNQSQIIAPNGGQAVFTVSAAPDCRFEVSGLPNWIASSTTGGYLRMPASGSMDINFVAAANLTGANRSATFTIGNNPVVITQTQDNACPSAAVPSPTAMSFPPASYGSAIQISAPQACPWSVSGIPSWIRSSSLSGTGNGSFTFSVTDNEGPARSAAILISGPGYTSSFTISQAARSCDGWTFSPSRVSFETGSSSNTFWITAPSYCNWTLGGIPSWITLTSNSSGSGSKGVGFQVAANAGAERTAVVTLTGAGPAFGLKLTQAGTSGTGCSTPISFGATLSGKLSSTCTSGARGAGYYAARHTFSGTPGSKITILLTSSYFDTYLYLRDAAGNIIASNDDGGGGTNSRIPATSGSYTLPAGNGGTYTIEVTSYYAGRVGSYALTLSQ